HAAASARRATDDGARQTNFSASAHRRAAREADRAAEARADRAAAQIAPGVFGRYAPLTRAARGLSQRERRNGSGAPPREARAKAAKCQTPEERYVRRWNQNHSNSMSGRTSAARMPQNSFCSVV